MNPNQNDRISYSFGMKLSLPAKYESADFHISLTSDVQAGETSATAFNRVKKEVELYAALAYQQIRNSDTGLVNEEKPKEVEAQSARPAHPVPENTPSNTPKPRDLKALKTQIKKAYGVLEAQKKVTKPDFVSKYLGGKKTDELDELGVTKAIVGLREDYPELGL